MGTTVFARGAKVLAPALLCVLCSIPALAEQRNMSISQAIEYSLQHNGELASLREEKGVHEAARVRAALWSNPTVEVEGATGALTGSPDENSLSLGVFQQFQLSGKREKRRELADRELEVYRWQLAERERALRYEVAEACYDVVLAERRVVVAERAVEANRQLLEVTRERLKSGDIPELEMDLARVEVTRSEGVRLDLANHLTEARAKLSTLLGLPEGDSLAVAGTLDGAAAVNKSLADLKQLARDHRPDLRSLETELQKGEAELALAQAERTPDLTAGVVVGRDTTSIEVAGMEGKDTAYTVGLKLSMPIPVFDRNQGGVQEARARRSGVEQRLAAARRSVEREVETAYGAYLNSEKVLSLYKSLMPQLEENLKLTQEAYRVSEVGILSVIQEQKKFSEVSELYLTALHDRVSALLKLESAVAADLKGGGK